MIKKLVRQMFIAQTLSALSVSLCLLIDNVMIGRFLGVDALAAYGLANPILLVIGALGSMLGAGVQVVCSRSLGRGSREETDQGYSSAIFTAAVLSLIFVLAVVIFRIPIARLMGAGEGDILKQTSSYMAGFVIGAPASMGALILVPFLQIAGKTNLLIAAVLGMTVSDIGLDLLNALVFNGGMFGMGLASSISYYVAVIIGGMYFFSKNCVFKFSVRRICLAKIRELFVGGVPTVVGMAATVVMVFAINKILLPVGGTAAVAAFSVINTIGSASNCISTGSSGVSLTMSGILFNEEDRTGLNDYLKTLIITGIVAGIVMMAILMVIAPFVVALFIGRETDSSKMATEGLRLFALGLAPCCVNNAFRGFYQGTGRIKTMEIISVMENAILPVLAAFVLSRIFGITGAWLYMAAGELLTVFGILLYTWIRNKRFTLRLEDIMMVPDSVGVRPEDMMEADIRDLNEVVEFSRKAEQFCTEHGQNPVIGRNLSLCIEEMGTNIVTRGISEAEKERHLLIRLLYKGNKWVLRFRDDCREFNPLEHMPDNAQSDDVGILIVMHMADEARYTYSMNLNNLMLILKNTQAAGSTEMS